MADVALLAPLTMKVVRENAKRKGVRTFAEKNHVSNHAFFRDNKALTWIRKKSTLLCILLFSNNCCLTISKKKCVITPILGEGGGGDFSSPC